MATVSAPTFRIFSFTSARARIACNFASIAFTSGRGMLAGPITPTQVSLFMPLMPSSTNVGVSGISTKRFSLAIATACSLPELTSGKAALAADQDESTVPDSTAATTSFAPL